MIRLIRRLLRHAVCGPRRLRCCSPSQYNRRRGGKRLPTSLASRVLPELGLASGLNYLRAGEAVSPATSGLCRCRGQFYLAFLLLVAGCLLAAELFRGPRARYLRTIFCGYYRHVDTHHSSMPSLRITPTRRPLTTTPSRGPGGWRGTGRRCGAPCALADVAAHRGSHRRAGGDAVVRRPDRRCQGISRVVGAGTSEPRCLAGANRQGHPVPATGCHCLIACQPPLRWALGAMAIPGICGIGRCSSSGSPTPGTGAPTLSKARQSCWYRVAGIPDHPACQTHYISAPAGVRSPYGPPIPWRLRLRRPTIVLGSVVALLASLLPRPRSWREHVIVSAPPAKS